MRYLLVVLLAIPLYVSGQSPQVPHKLEFAGMTLTIRDDARREIQKDVDALTRSPRHFMIKVERARTYFPIIEKVFAEERLPDDFKYLVLQESALIPDAVSVSQAVGFWQFKDFTAVEMGLRVDRDVDERMNIVSSSRAAARYMKKNNFYFNNWLYALQAYQMGAGGAMKAIKDDKAGAKHMEITSKTYWYVKKFLAHKIAFQDAVNSPGELTVAPLPSGGHHSLKGLAKDVSMTPEELLAYNKWVRRDGIPADKEYTILVPVNNATRDYLIAARATTREAASLASSKAPEKVPATTAAERTASTRINGVPAIAARAGETPAALAKRTGVELKSFLKYNDLSARQRLVAGEYYFTAKKRNRAAKDYHKLAEGESLWEVSQHYGIRLTRLLRFNRLDDDSRPGAGTMLYLSSKKPKGGGLKAAPEDVLEVDKNSLFAWSADPAAGVTVSNSSSRRQESTPRVESVPAPEPEKISIKTDEPVKEITSDESAPGPNMSTVQASGDTSPVAEPESVPVRVSEAREHEVLPGETLYGISRKYNVAVMDIARWNNVDMNVGIKPGQVLKLEGEPQEMDVAPSTVTAASEIVHEVRASDTLYSVARKYGVSIKELMEWNEKSDFNIHIGEKLKVLPR
ncbi:MAG TPA: LysM peptidoglycan-binding domain-containing protein [Cyclobacteriaceae bacterium]|nr:LysM peptidoglycan-binding domain-containing protein [Cyclobacteriaceae bacterium]